MVLVSLLVFQPSPGIEVLLIGAVCWLVALRLSGCGVPGGVLLFCSFVLILMLPVQIIMTYCHLYQFSEGIRFPEECDPVL